MPSSSSISSSSSTAVLPKMMKLIYTLLSTITEYRQVDDTGARVLANMHNLALRLELLGRTMKNNASASSSTNDDNSVRKLSMTVPSFSSPSSHLTTRTTRGIPKNSFDSSSSTVDPTLIIPFSYDNYRILGPLLYSSSSSSLLLYTKTVQEYRKQSTLNLPLVYTDLENYYTQIINYIHEIEGIYFTSSTTNVSSFSSIDTNVGDILYFLHLLQQWLTKNLRQKFEIIQSIQLYCNVDDDTAGSMSDDKNNTSTNNRVIPENSVPLMIRQLDRYTRLWTFTTVDDSFPIRKNDSNDNVNTMDHTLNTLLWKITAGNKCMEDVFLV